MKERCKINIYLFEWGDDGDVAIAISILDVFTAIALDYQNHKRRYEVTKLS
ncbi:MAG: hypothetical protein RMZ41_025380 [Nostoc sp. DedVER02]|uniref:hypothetical protein n=1 Tax=unclassified Nostoc TaxID=2593658 RepID=UPI002AD4979D|nr:MULTISPECIES: hypothetical protein [unclassified Nostoc]MDZ7987753.1 hypothetical protein [Nostoc sp. DedVER02]MDZ8116160.1 hypothetical protein [Nostoc sp. DedVER01b]